MTVQNVLFCIFAGVNALLAAFALLQAVGHMKSLLSNNDKRHIVAFIGHGLFASVFGALAAVTFSENWQ